MPKKSNNEKKKDAEAAGRPPKKTKQANKILISWTNVFVIIKFLLFIDKHFFLPTYYRDDFLIIRKFM